MTQKYPLAWPAGWPRAKYRADAKFGKSEMVYKEGIATHRQHKDLTMEDAMRRVGQELERLGVNARDDSLVSTNLTLNMSGLPRGNQGEPGDPGVAVYFQKKGSAMRVIAIDRYNRVRDNLAAIAATLEAMRAIERHGGAQILERAFTGFDALPAPDAFDPWAALGLKRGASRDDIEAKFRTLSKVNHPDAPGGSTHRFQVIERARRECLAQI